MSYKEKSVIGVLCITLAVMGWFFINAFEIYQAGNARVGSLLELSVVVIIVMVVAEVLYEAHLAIWHHGNVEEDERDQLFDLRGEKISSFVLHLAVYCGLGVILINDAMELLGADRLFWAVLVLIAGITLSEVVKCLVQIFHYRRGY